MKTLIIAIALLTAANLNAQTSVSLGTYNPELDEVTLDRQEILQNTIEDWVGRRLEFGKAEFHLHPEGKSMIVSWPVHNDRISRTGMLLEIDDQNRVVSDRTLPVDGKVGGGIKYTFTCEGDPCSLCDVGIQWVTWWQPKVRCVCKDDGRQGKICNMTVSVELEVGL